MFKKQIAIFVLIVVLTNIGTGLMTSLYWRFKFSAYDAEIIIMAVTAGNLEAEVDYHRGIYRYYNLSDNAELKFTGDHQGLYEVWDYPLRSELGYANILATKSFVETYDERVRDISAHIAATNSVK